MNCPYRVAVDEDDTVQVIGMMAHSSNSTSGYRVGSSIQNCDAFSPADDTRMTPSDTLPSRPSLSRTQMVVKYASACE